MAERETRLAQDQVSKGVGVRIPPEVPIMFLYEPRTDEQKLNLLKIYRIMIDNPVVGFITLLMSGYHYRFYFVTKHLKNKTWQTALKSIERHRGLDTMDKVNVLKTDFLIVLICIFGLFSYYYLYWIVWMLRISVNYKKIRQEAPINLLELS